MAPWQDLPPEHADAWNKAFANASGIDVAASCPVCAAKALHIYFHRHRADTGGVWRWCSGCFVYDHGTARIPSWWREPELLPEEQLLHAPGDLERARAARYGAG